MAHEPGRLARDTSDPFHTQLLTSWQRNRVEATAEKVPVHAMLNEQPVFGLGVKIEGLTDGTLAEYALADGEAPTQHRSNEA